MVFLSSRTLEGSKRTVRWWKHWKQLTKVLKDFSVSLFRQEQSHLLTTEKNIFLYAEKLDPKMTKDLTWTHYLNQIGSQRAERLLRINLIPNCFWSTDQSMAGSFVDSFHVSFAVCLVQSVWLKVQTAQNEPTSRVLSEGGPETVYLPLVYLLMCVSVGGL